ncbi:MAG: phosphoribosyltransferase [Vulcanisaeta sp.]|nr:phosphoribosyltransferase [Vulcanisaeta sp.]
MKRVIKYDGRSTYSIDIAGLRRELPIVYIGEVVINGSKYKAYIASDADLVLGDVEFINAVSRELAGLVSQYRPGVVVVPESKAIALAYSLSRELGINRFVVVRKSVKAYMGGYVKVSVNSITTRETQYLVLDPNSVNYLRNKDVCLMDDVVSTGSTMRGMEELMSKVGTNIVCRAAIWIEGPWVSDDYVIHLGELPIFVEEIN